MARLEEAMIRFFKHIVVIIFVVGLTAGQLVFAPDLLAQSSVKLRTGEHKGYSRVVLEWPARVGYQTSQNAQTFTVTFNNAGALNASSLNASNVNNMNIISSDPLKLSFSLPKDVSPRHFFVGNRLVIDFYGNGVSRKVQSKKTPKPPESVNEKIVRDALDDEEQVQVDTPPEPVLTPSAFKPHMVRFSSTESLSVAAFQYAGALWSVLDVVDPLIRPQIDGPDANAFYPIEDIALDGGKAFRMPIFDNANIYTEGDNVLWKLVITPDEVKKAPVLPQNLDVDAEKPRSGKVLWPLKSAGKIINMEDPVTGAPLIIVTSNSSDDYTGPARSFIDFDTLPSAVGLAIRPKTGGLVVTKTPRGVEIFHPDGLALSSDDTMRVITQAAARKAAADKETSKKVSRRIFDFEEWRMGGLSSLNENKSVLLSNLKELDRGKRAEELINLSKMHLANGRGAEALGFLSIAADEVPELRDNPKLIALRGAARAFDYKSEDAFRDLSNKKLNAYDEIKHWRAFALADLGDWQQAIDTMPDDISVLEIYPPEVRNRLGLVLAEVALRAGDVEKAEKIFSLKSDEKDELNMSHAANLNYLKGEAARQKGDVDDTIEKWKNLSEGPDDLYRAKAGLALARVLSEEKDLPVKEAIESLERLRYAWRGDGLEGQINYWLGRAYLGDNQTNKGLRLMRKSIELTENQDISDVIAQEMQDVFLNFFTGDKLPNASPIEAVELYDNFQELTPVGKDGDLVVTALAEHLVANDLFSRADNLLSHQIEHRLSGDDAARAAIRLAAIRLLDKNAAPALESLDNAQSIIAALPADDIDPSYAREIALLRARAMSENGDAMDSLNMLEAMGSDPDTNRLRANIAWEAGFWDDAAAALNDVIIDENISLTRPLEKDQAMLILRRAVALNLSGDRIALANMRTRYGDVMRQTESARLFDVVTRQRNNTGLSDRETLLSITSEVDLFTEFLEGYREIK